MARFYNEGTHAEMDLKVGDKVYLQSTNIQTSRPSHKLEHKCLGPYTIIEKIGHSSYKLALPASMKVHPVFNVSLLHRAPEDQFNHQPKPLPPVLTPDGEEEYVVEWILDSKKIGRQLEYYVK